MTNQLITHWLSIDYLLMSLIIDEICLVIIIEKKNATLASIKRLIHYSNCTYRQSFAGIFIMPFGIIAEIDSLIF